MFSSLHPLWLNPQNSGSRTQIKTGNSNLSPSSFHLSHCLSLSPIRFSLSFSRPPSLSHPISLLPATSPRLRLSPFRRRASRRWAYTGAITDASSIRAASARGLLSAPQPAVGSSKCRLFTLVSCGSSRTSHIRDSPSSRDSLAITPSSSTKFPSYSLTPAVLRFETPPSSAAGVPGACSFTLASTPRSDTSALTSRPQLSPIPPILIN